MRNGVLTAGQPSSSRSADIRALAMGPLPVVWFPCRVRLGRSRVRWLMHAPHTATDPPLSSCCIIYGSCARQRNALYSVHGEHYTICQSRVVTQLLDLTHATSKLSTVALFIRSDTWYILRSLISQVFVTNAHQFWGKPDVGNALFSDDLSSIEL